MQGQKLVVRATRVNLRRNVQNSTTEEYNFSSAPLLPPHSVVFRTGCLQGMKTSRGDYLVNTSSLPSSISTEDRLAWCVTLKALVRRGYTVRTRTPCG